MGFYRLSWPSWVLGVLPHTVYNQMDPNGRFGEEYDDQPVEISRHNLDISCIPQKCCNIMLSYISPILFVKSHWLIDLSLLGLNIQPRNPQKQCWFSIGLLIFLGGPVWELDVGVAPIGCHQSWSVGRPWEIHLWDYPLVNVYIAMENHHPYYR